MARRQWRAPRRQGGRAKQEHTTMAHAIMLDTGWESAAKEILGWLEERKL